VEPTPSTAGDAGPAGQLGLIEGVVDPGLAMSSSAVPAASRAAGWEGGDMESGDIECGALSPFSPFSRLFLNRV
jgi:hypothetical protein